MRNSELLLFNLYFFPPSEGLFLSHRVTTPCTGDYLNLSNGFFLFINAFVLQELSIHHVASPVVAELRFLRLGESMYKRDGLMASVTVTSATPEVHEHIYFHY